MAEALAVHYEKNAEPRFLRKASASCVGARELKVEHTEQFVIKFDNALGCEEAHILNQFLSIDSGQPLSRLNFVGS